MKEKLLALMKSEGLRPSQLAEMLEINPAGVSHILAGRNKPGFDLLQKILRRFPRINPDWLLLDSEKMYRSDEDAPKLSTDRIAPALKGTMIAEGLFGPDTISPGAGKPGVGMPGYQPRRSAAANAPSSDSALSDAADSAGNLVTGLRTKADEADVERVVIFYTDRTFECYTPTKR